MQTIQMHGNDRRANWMTQITLKHWRKVPRMHGWPENCAERRRFFIPFPRPATIRLDIMLNKRVKERSPIPECKLDNTRKTKYCTAHGSPHVFIQRSLEILSNQLEIIRKSICDMTVHFSRRLNNLSLRTEELEVTLRNLNNRVSTHLIKNGTLGLDEEINLDKPSQNL